MLLSSVMDCERVPRISSCSRYIVLSLPLRAIMPLTRQSQVRGACWGATASRWFRLGIANSSCFLVARWRSVISRGWNASFPSSHWCNHPILSIFCKNIGSFWFILMRKAIFLPFIFAISENNANFANTYKRSQTLSHHLTKNNCLWVLQSSCHPLASFYLKT